MRQKWNRLELDKQVYWIGIFLILGLGVFGIVYLGLVSAGMSFPCMFQAVFHLSCPGCGGTRATTHLLQGHFLEALWYHPLVPYAVFVGGADILSHTLKFLHVSGVRGMKFRNGYLWTDLGIIIVNFVLKNILLIEFHITLDSFLGGF